MLRWDDIDLTAGRLHVSRAKGGDASVQPISARERSFEKDDLTVLVTSAARAAADAAAEKVELVMYAIFLQLAESKKLLLSEDEREELLVRQSLLATAPHHFKHRLAKARVMRCLRQRVRSGSRRRPVKIYLPWGWFAAEDRLR